MITIEIHNGELISTLAELASERGIANGAIVSLIGAADVFSLSTMSADGHTKYVLTDYSSSAELSGTGEIMGGATQAHAAMAIEGDRGICSVISIAPMSTLGSHMPTYFPDMMASTVHQLG